MASSDDYKQLKSYFGASKEMITSWYGVHKPSSTILQKYNNWL
jgi:hypothetical protein